MNENQSFKTEANKNSLFNFFWRSIGNKLYTILGLVSVVVLIIVITANFTGSTLTMVASFSRM